MKKLIIIHYPSSTIHVFKLERETPVDEEYIESLGFSLSECHWIAGEVVFDVHTEKILR